MMLGTLSQGTGIPVKVTGSAILFVVLCFSANIIKSFLGVLDYRFVKKVNVGFRRDGWWALRIFELLAAGLRGECFLRIRVLSLGSLR